jgi:hypothetical protein
VPELGAYLAAIRPRMASLKATEATTALARN